MIAHLRSFFVITSLSRAGTRFKRRLGWFLAVAWVVSACSATPPAATRPPASQVVPPRTIQPTARQTPARTPTAVPPSLTPTSAIPVLPAQLQGLQLVFWHPFSGADQATLEQLVAQFNQQNEWQIQVNLLAAGGWGQLDEMVRQANSGMVAPDLLVGYNYQALSWDAGGWLLADQSIYAGDPRWGLDAAAQADFYPSVWAQDFVPDGWLRGAPAAGGKRLGLPWYRSAEVLYYNTSWARELGFSSAPQTPDELRLQLCAAARFSQKTSASQPGGAGGWLVTSDPGILSSLIFAFGGDAARLDRSGYQFNTPAVRQAVEFLNRLYNDGCAWMDPEIDPFQALAGRRALVVALSSAEVANVRAAFGQAASTDDWAVLPFATAKGEPTVDAFGPALLVLQSDARRQLAAWLFARWLVSPQNQAAWSAATGMLPVSAQGSDLLKARSGVPAQQVAAAAYLPYAHAEPVYTSWGLVRPALAEALDYIVIAGQTPETLSSVLQNLDQLASDIYTQNP